MPKSALKSALKKALKKDTEGELTSSAPSKPEKLNPFGASLVAFITNETSTTPSAPTTAAATGASQAKTVSSKPAQNKDAKRPSKPNQAPATPTEAQLALATAKALAREKEKRKQKKLLLAKDHVAAQFDNIEKKLLQIATKGVVTLFNAVAKQQQEVARLRKEKLNETAESAKEAKLVKEVVKDGFLQRLRESTKQAAGTAGSSSGSGAAERDKSVKKQKTLEESSSDEEDDDEDDDEDQEMDEDDDDDDASAAAAAEEEQKALRDIGRGKAGVPKGLVGKDAAKIKAEQAKERSGKGWRAFDEDYLVKRKQTGWRHDDSEDDDEDI